MSTVVIGGGGPRPQARVVGIVEAGQDTPTTYAVMDGDLMLCRFTSKKWADTLLPLIQSGE